MVLLLYALVRGGRCGRGCPRSRRRGGAGWPGSGGRTGGTTSGWLALKTKVGGRTAACVREVEADVAARGARRWRPVGDDGLQEAVQLAGGDAARRLFEHPRRRARDLRRRPRRCAPRPTGWAPRRGTGTSPSWPPASRRLRAGTKSFLFSTRIARPPGVLDQAGDLRVLGGGTGARVDDQHGHVGARQLIARHLRRHGVGQRLDGAAAPQPRRVHQDERPARRPRTACRWDRAWCPARRGPGRAPRPAGG